MSEYQAAIEQWKTETTMTKPPPLERIDQIHRTGGDPELVSTARAWIIRASLGMAIIGFAGMVGFEVLIHQRLALTGRAMAVLLPIGALLVTMAWLRQRDLAKQMMVRALAWSTLVIGTIVSVFGLIPFAWTGPLISLGAGTALLLMGSRGLGLTSRSFQPMAFRNHLLLALVLATADTGTLLFGSTLQLGMALEFGSPGYFAQSGATLACGLVMAVAVLGIYRLRTWALVLNLLANVGIAFVAMSGYLGLTIPVATALATTATMQLMLPVPILAAALGDPLRDRSPFGRLGPPAVRVGLALMIGISMVGVMVPSASMHYSIWRQGWVDRIHRTWIRGVVKQRGVPGRVKTEVNEGPK
ncbi:MAG: hypothetical protein AAF799_13745 [Myxococcota bacterium]